MKNFVLFCTIIFSQVLFASHDFAWVDRVVAAQEAAGSHPVAIEQAVFEPYLEEAVTLGHSVEDARVEPAVDNFPVQSVSFSDGSSIEIPGYVVQQSPVLLRWQADLNEDAIAIGQTLEAGNFSYQA